MKRTPNTILITGGTSGIGRAMAAQLLKRGDTVLITGRSAERLAETRKALPGVRTFVCDQSDPADIARLQAEVTRAFPDLNVLINNAGIGLKLDLNDASRPLADLEREIRTNLVGPIQLIQAFLPQLKRQRAATIANVTSGLGFLPMPLKPIYCASKAAMHSYTQSLRVQLASTSVEVIEIIPPALDTDFNKGQEEMNSRALMDADKFAAAAIRGLLRGHEEVGAGLSPIMRLIARLNPRAVIRRKDAEQMASAG